MFRTCSISLCIATAFAKSFHGQTIPAPAQFRLVVPHSPGSLLIDGSDGWVVGRVEMYDHGTRPVVQVKNERLGLVASYILDDEPQYNDTSEMCRNDMLGGVMKGALSNASVTHKTSNSRTLPDGRTLLMGSYLVEKVEGVPLRQENVWGFIAEHHLCAAIHISRTPFSSGEEHLFDPVLNSFRFEANYQPTADDYALMAKMLPPEMASLYGSSQSVSPLATAPQSGLAFTNGSLRFALPKHNGLLTLDAPSYKITELSAKPGGQEFGIRARDSALNTEVLGFLFLPQPLQPNAVACREWMLKEEEKSAKQMGIVYRKILGKREIKSDSGVTIAVVEYEQSKDPSPNHFIRRLFVAEDDLCADISMSASDEARLGPSMSLLETLRFDPNRPPDFFAKFAYANVLMDHQNPAAAAPYFEESIPLAASTDDPLKWKRIATDQATIAYGMSGDLKRSRDINEAAIKSDPEYPLYYYNLACADAEQGDAQAARQHLEQAFQRRANTIPGEHLPDPTKDDSILKLRKNKEFWSFVESLPKS